MPRLRDRMVDFNFLLLICCYDPSAGSGQASFDPTSLGSAPRTATHRTAEQRPLGS